MMIKKINFEASLLILPLVSVYVFIFWLSNDTAKDRKNYAVIFGQDNDVRGEAGYVLIARALNSVFNDPYLSMLVLQALVFLLAFSLILISLPKDKATNILAKSVIWISVLLTIFGMLLGVQIRFGLAAILAVFLVINNIDCRENGLTVMRFLVLFSTVFFHYGVLPFVIISAVFAVRNKTSRENSIIAFIFIFIVLCLIPPLFVMVLSFLGFSSYYYGYFNGDFQQERLISFSLVFYVGFIISCFLIRRVNPVALIGLSFFLASVVTELAVYQKMGLPFLLYGVANSLANIKLHPSFRFPAIAISILSIPVAFIYFSMTVGLI